MNEVNTATTSETHVFHYGDSVIVLLPTLAKMVIINKDAIITKCLLCDQTRDVFMLTDNTSIGWLRLCRCDDQNDQPAPSPQLAISSDFLPFSVLSPDSEVAQ